MRRGEPPQKENVHSDPCCRDRYEGQLNEFLLENKNLKEQLTTLQVLCSKSFFNETKLKFAGCGGPVGRRKGGGARSSRFKRGTQLPACFRQG